MIGVVVSSRGTTKLALYVCRMPEPAVDFVSTFESDDVGDPAGGKPIPEPIGTVQRPMTSRIFIADNACLPQADAE